MKAIEIIGQSLKMLGENDFVASQGKLTEEQERLKDKLLDCLNFALREVATDYLPFVKAENVVVADGIVKYCDLKETFSKAVSLFVGGEETDFETTPSEIKTNRNGNGVLTYRYIPKTLTANDEICDCRLKTEYMVNGTLCYYYFSGGMYDLAEHFEKRFLSGIKREKNSIVLPQRRWI